MNDIYYLEPDEEITSVIDRLKNSSSDGVSLVIPRGATIAQSIVNLKLLKKSADELSKEISLVATDRISRNLASQIGITVYSKVSEAEKATPSLIKKTSTGKEEDDLDSSGNGFKVNSYYQKKDEEAVGEDEEEVVGDAEIPEEEATDDSEADELDEADQKDASEQREKSRAKMTRQEKHDQDIEEAKKELSERKKESETIKISVQEESIAESEDEPDAEDVEEDDEPEADEAPVKFEKKEVKEMKQSHKKTRVAGSRKPILVIAAVTIILLLAVSYLFLPYASASVQIKADNLTVTNKVIVDKEAKAIDEINMVIPGTVVEVEKQITKTYQSTGKKTVGDKATGKVTIYNDYDSLSHKIAAGTKFTSGGKVFTNTTEVTVPGLTNPKIVAGVFQWDSGTIDVSLVASEVGSDYNIAPSTFSIAGMPSINNTSKIYARSAAAMSGGTTKHVTYVTDQDLQNASNDIKKDVVATNKAEVVSSANQSKLTVIESNINYELISGQASKQVNEEADNFDYSVTVRVYGLGYASDDLEKLMADTVQSGLESDKMMVASDKAEVRSELSDSNATTLTLKTTYKGKIGQKISADEIKNKIKNKKYSTAKSLILDTPSVQNVELKVWPSEILRVPFMANRINVKFDYSQE